MKLSIEKLARFCLGTVMLLLSSCAQVTTISPDSYIQNTTIPTPSPRHTPTISPTPCPTPYGGISERIAFTSDRDGNLEIYIMYASGFGLTNISNNPFDDEVGAWSPDGRELIFATNRDGNYEVYLMNADGSAQKNLTNNPADDYATSWSPYSNKIVFNSNRDGDSEIFIMNHDGSGVMQITENKFDDYGAFWSPDGNKLIFTSERDGNAEIYVMNTDGSSQERLTSDPGIDYSNGWSPDGNKVIFESDRDGDYDIYVMNADGTGIENLTDNDDFDFAADWSSDGTIVFSSYRSLHQMDESPSVDLFLMNIDGSDEVRMTYSPSDDVIPLWQPVSRVINSSESSCENLYLSMTENIYLPTLSTPLAVEDIDIEQLLFQPRDLPSDWNPVNYHDDCLFCLWDALSSFPPSRVAGQLIGNDEDDNFLVEIAIFDPSENMANWVWNTYKDQLQSTLDESPTYNPEIPYIGEEGAFFLYEDFLNLWHVFFYRCNVFVLIVVDAPVGHSIEYAKKLDPRIQYLFCKK